MPELADSERRQDYRPGQVVDGRVLTEDGRWVFMTARPSSGPGYWARFRRRFRWVALGIVVVVLAAVLPWPWGHGTTLVGLHLPGDWLIVALDSLWYLVVVGLPVGLLVAAFPARSPKTVGD